MQEIKITNEDLSPVFARLTNGHVAKIVKRDGSKAPFDIAKIAVAAYKAMLASDEGTEADAARIARRVYGDIKKLQSKDSKYAPTVESVQDLVEKHLIIFNFAETARAFILYRKERADIRAQGSQVPVEVRDHIKTSSKYFHNRLAEFVYYRTYSRWIPEKRRRETWAETVERFMDFMKENLEDKLTAKEYKEVKNGILNQDIVPSMRLMWASGEAARRTNVAAYNCSFIAPTALIDFGEIMYCLMCGTGVGFSVESPTVQQLPQIKRQTGKRRRDYMVRDSKEGWADAYIYGLKTWFAGEDVEFDYSKLRLKGARLKTMGGRSSGPDPLRSLIDFSRTRVMSRQGKRLTNLDVHDIVCKIGEIVVAGGVRRSALISLSDLDDTDMRHAKDGAFYINEPQRAMANNSAVYTEKPSATDFLEEWTNLAKSGSGERGIFNRSGLASQLPARRWEKNAEFADEFGTNPCGEIYLRNKQFCNLTSIVVREEDNQKELLRKIRLATILGTYQSTLTNFKYLSDTWKNNCDEERLLGVSITGYWDNMTVRKPKTLRALRDSAVDVNSKYAKRFGVNQSTCVTCVKPSGNSSQLLDTASGMHPRYSKYYVRRVRISSTDPLLHMLRDQGVPCHPEVGQSEADATTYVLDYPVKSPGKGNFKDDISALELLEEWRNLKENFTEHNPSATIYVGEDEWIDVGQWVYNNWDIVGGLSFLPRNNHVYQLAPYEEINAKEYKELKKRTANIDFSKLPLYEYEDNTEGARELACVSGACEL